MPRVYEHPLQDAVLAAMDGVGPVTRADLELMTGLNYNQTLQALRGLRRKRKIYIAKYTRQDGKGGRCTPHYAIGDKKDVQPPEQVSSLERNAKYRKRHQARINAKNMARRGRVYNNPWKGLEIYGQQTRV